MFETSLTIVVAVALERSTMESIRSIQHRDANGDIIGSDHVCFENVRRNPNADVVDPDRSNPTRPRFERPLDTIRAFEAAIDGAYARRPFTRTGRRNKRCEMTFAE